MVEAVVKIESLEEGGWELLCPDADAYEFELPPEISALFVKPAVDASAGYLHVFYRITEFIKKINFNKKYLFLSNNCCFSGSEVL